MDKKIKKMIKTTDKLESQEKRLLKADKKQDKKIAACDKMVMAKKKK